MLKKTTVKLAGSLFGASVLSIIISILIVLTFGGIGAKSMSPSSSNQTSVSSSAASYDSQQSSAISAASSGSSSVNLTLTSSAVNSLYSEGGLISTKAGKMFIGILCIFFFCCILYGTSWSEGNRDPNRINYGHMNKFMAKGFIAGLFASIPYAVLAVIFLIAQAVAPESALRTVSSTIYRLVNIQFIVIGDAFTNYPIFCILLLLPLPVVAEIGYVLGFHHVVFASKIIYKDRPEENKKVKKIKR